MAVIVADWSSALGLILVNILQVKNQTVRDLLLVKMHTQRYLLLAMSSPVSDIKPTLLCLIALHSSNLFFHHNLKPSLCFNGG